MPTRLVGAREAFRRFMETWIRRTGNFDLVHAWGLRSLHLLSTCPEVDRCIGTIDAIDLHPRVVTSLQDLQHTLSLQLQVGCDGLRRWLINAGLSSLTMPLRPPSVRVEDLDMESRSDWRAAWDVDDETIVLGIPGNPKEWVNLRSLVGVPARLSLLGYKVRLLAHPLVHAFDTCRTCAGTIGFEDLVVAEEAMSNPWKILPALDVVLLPGTTGRRREAMGMLPLAWAMAAGRPVLLGHGHPAANSLQDHPGVYLNVDHDENLATRWLLDHLEQDTTIDPPDGFMIDFPQWVDQLRRDYELDVV
jgi:hypothetical protein